MSNHSAVSQATTWGRGVLETAFLLSTLVLPALLRLL